MSTTSSSPARITAERVGLSGGERAAQTHHAHAPYQPHHKTNPSQQPPTCLFVYITRARKPAATRRVKILPLTHNSYTEHPAFFLGYLKRLLTAPTQRMPHSN